MPLLSDRNDREARDSMIQLSMMRRSMEDEAETSSRRDAVLQDSALMGFSRELLNGSETGRPVCGCVGCRSLWTPPWRSRRHPYFEGRWACSAGCVLEMVRAAIAREMGDGRRDGTPLQHHHRIPLGLVMLAQGWITHPQLRKALDSQRTSGKGRIGDWLVSECGLESECVTRGLSVQWNCPVLTTDGFSPEAMALAMPRVFVERYGILPLRIAGSKILYVGFEEHLDASSAFAVEQMSGLRTESGVVADKRFREARELLLECRFADVTRSVVPDRDMLARSIAKVIYQRRLAASRLVRLHEYYWLRVWPESATSVRKLSLLAALDGAQDFIFTIGG